MFGGNKSDCVSGWEENNQFHRQNEAAWIFYSLQSKDVENIWETKDKQLVSDSSVIITWSCPLTVKKVSRSWWNFSSSAFLPMYLSTWMMMMRRRTMMATVMRRMVFTFWNAPSVWLYRWKPHTRKPSFPLVVAWAEFSSSNDDQLIINYTWLLFSWLFRFSWLAKSPYIRVPTYC